MIHTCPFETRSHKEFSIVSLQGQTNPGERLTYETLYGFKNTDPDYILRSIASYVSTDSVLLHLSKTIPH